MSQVDIYFSDLNPEAQQRVLSAAGYKDPKEGNWDVLPLTQLGMITSVIPTWKPPASGSTGWNVTLTLINSY